MKTRRLLSFAAGLVLVADFASPLAADPKAPDNVTVAFKDPDNFTDIRDNKSDFPIPGLLEDYRLFIQKTAGPLLAAGQKLSVTITDLDLAGDTRQSMHDIRIVSELFPPRCNLTFQLTEADGKVVKEGDRRLINRDFMLEAKMGMDRSDPLYYDKELLRRWLVKEFKAGS